MCERILLLVILFSFMAFDWYVEISQLALLNNYNYNKGKNIINQLSTSFVKVIVEDGKNNMEKNKENAKKDKGKVNLIYLHLLVTGNRVV